MTKNTVNDAFSFLSNFITLFINSSWRSRIRCLFVGIAVNGRKAFRKTSRRLQKNLIMHFSPLTNTALIPSPRFLVQFRQDKVCVKFIQGSQKNGNIPTCKRKNNRLLEVAVP